MSKKHERGSAAVEFAIILPVLLSLALGIVEFGYVFNQQISLTQAAREGARAYSLNYANTSFVLNNSVQAAAPALGPVTSTATSTCSKVGDIAIVTVSRSYSSLTGWFNFLNTTTLQGKGAMRCGG